MKKWEVFTGLVALAMAFLGKLKGLLSLLLSAVVVTVSVDGDIGHALACLLAEEGRRLRANSRMFGERKMYIRPLHRMGSVVFEDMTRSSGMYFYRGRPMWLTGGSSASGRSLSYLRWTLNLDDLLLHAFECKEKRDQEPDSTMNRHRVYYHFSGGKIDIEKAETRMLPTSRVLKWKHAECGSPMRGGLSGIVLSPSTQSVINEVGDWVTNRDWYYEHSVPWRHGLLLHGEPGTGKTSIARALAEEHKLPVHVIDLTNLDNVSLRQIWQTAVSDTPCMVVLEDVDRIFKGDCITGTDGGRPYNPKAEPVEPGAAAMDALAELKDPTPAELQTAYNALVESLNVEDAAAEDNEYDDEDDRRALTFDAILNCIDGIEQVDGVLLVMTANHPERLDQALLRPGRIDTKVEIGRLDYGTRLKLAERIIGATPDAAHMALESGDVTAAMFVKLCRQRALDIRAGRVSRASEGPYR